MVWGQAGEPSLCSSLKSFHKEYPSFQLTSKSTCSPPPLSLSLPRVFVLVLHVSISTFLFSTLAIASAYLQFFFFASIVFRYFAFFTNACNRQSASRVGSEFSLQWRRVRASLTDRRKRIVFPILEIVRLLDSFSYSNLTKRKPAGRVEVAAASCPPYCGEVETIF